MSKKPKKSLRTLLMLWFLVFSVVPLAFITGYSVVKYEQAMDQEQKKRLTGNYREIVTILTEFEGELKSKISQHSRDGSLAYYMSQRQITKVRQVTKEWLSSSLAHRLSVFNKAGRLDVALFKDEKGELKRRTQVEGGDVYLSEEFLDRLSSSNQYEQVEVRNGSSLDLIAFAKILNSKGRLVGYIEEIIELDKSFLLGLKKRMNLEIVFFTATNKESVKTQPIVATHPDLELYKPQFFVEQEKNSRDGFFEIDIREKPYGFVIKPLRWGNQRFYMAIGASKEAVIAVLRNVNYAFFTVVIAIIILLVILSFIISKILLKPVSDLLNAIQNARPGEAIPKVDIDADTELGILAENFNNLFSKVNKTQGQLKQNISELENANVEIKDAQSKLVHAAKMASLGQLVAGVAHELNNPIGFIFSNMGHLKEYSESLMKLADVADKNPDQVAKAKKEIEYDYIKKDLPKLIKSCEDGARRTRDIVVGLRNFSRLEEVKLSDVDVEESLENTLNLLSGELKNRIEVIKEFEDVGKIKGYPSQLNQVFMNVLSNAAQAIAKKGTIKIATSAVDKKTVRISISDSGKGMDEKTKEQIFDPFFTTKSLGQGTGLGLSLSYGIVENHGGEIIVDSKKGKGTTFHIELPVKGPKK